MKTEAELLTHIKRLSAIKSNKGIRFLSPAADGIHCPLHMASAMVKRIGGLSSLVVGTQECATYHNQPTGDPYGRNGGIHWSYVLDANEVVFGCREGLIDALTEMDQAGAEIILVLVTCIPELIGEDMQGVIYEIQPKLKARLNFVPLAHFRCNGYAAGYYRTLAAITEFMEPQTKLQSSVNVIGHMHRGVLTSPLASFLQSKGISIRILGEQGQYVRDFLQAPDAALNILLSPDGGSFARQMEKQFGIPYVSLHDMYKMEDIDDAFSKITDHLGLSYAELQLLYEAERNALIELHLIAKERLSGIRYLSLDSSYDPIPLSVYLSTFNMTPLLLHVEEFYEEDKQWSSQLRALGHDPWIGYSVNAASEAPIYEALQPDFCLGSLTHAKNKIPHTNHLRSIYSQYGYGRSLFLLKQILQSLEISNNPKLGERG